MPAERVAVLEDSMNGIRAASAAGAGAVIGVGGGALATDATVVVRDLTALAWRERGSAVLGAGRLR